MSCATRAIAADRRWPAPGLPVNTHWSVDLTAGVSVAPVGDAHRVFVALSNAQVAALSAADGRELWRSPKEVTTAMAVSDGLLFLSAGDAIEALRADNGATAWLAPRLKAVAPLVAAGGLVFAVTDSEVVALQAKDGQPAWRHQAGGVRVAPVADGDRVFVGADDGRILALDVKTGAPVWESYVGGGVTSLGAGRGLVYAGSGDKQFHCVDARNGKSRWLYRIGAIPTGAIAVDDERVYFSALDNVLRALDRETGNQRWQAPLTRRPIDGVRLAGHVVFVQVIGKELLMLLDRTGARSGVIPLPGEATRGGPPFVGQVNTGVQAVVVTGSLANQWQLTMIGPAGEAALEPFDRFTLPGLDFLTDPALVPIGRTVPWLVLDDPVLEPWSALEWPLVMRDPPLVPLTTIPGIQLRPLSPVLPVRRGA